jgi:hypothetical protein
MKRLFGLVFLGMMLMGAALPAAAGADESGPTFGIRPASGGAADPNSGTFFQYVLTPGSTVTDEALVLNRGEKAIDLDLYAADGDTAVNGSATFGGDGQDYNGVRHWLSTQVTSLHLEPGDTATVPFTLNVPGTITPGDWVAGWVIQAPARPAQGGIGINMIERAGVAVVVHVPGPSNPYLELGGTCYQGGGGASYFQVEVSNPSNVLTKASGTFTLTSEGGVRIFEQATELGVVIPGDDTVLHIESPAPPPPPGKYEAATTLRLPDGRSVAASSPVEVSDRDDGCPLLAVAGEREEPDGGLPDLPGGSFPWLVLIASLVALLLALLVAREYLRRRNRLAP